MKITGIRCLHADFGWRVLSFLKVETDGGLVGWSEYYEGAGNRGLSGTIAALGEQIVGSDPTRTAALANRLAAMTLQAPGGLSQQAIAALTNACLDIAAKALDRPVADLFAGRLREWVPVYWSHGVSYRVRYADYLGLPAPQTYDDIAKLAEEARAAGYSAFKTNIVLPEKGSGFRGYSPTRGRADAFPALTLSSEVEAAALRQMQVLREGGGADLGLKLDINFFLRPEAAIRLARTLEPIRLAWLEVDNHDVGALADIRNRAPMSIASLEHVYGAAGYRPFLEARAADIAIVDPVWNGFWESRKIATVADAFEVNIAPHNYYGYLADFISLHLAAATPNLHIMETDPEGVPWRAELYTHAPEVERGEMRVPDRPGWGTDIDEAAVSRHPPR